MHGRVCVCRGGVVRREDSKAGGGGREEGELTVARVAAAKVVTEEVRKVEVEKVVVTAEISVGLDNLKEGEGKGSWKRKESRISRGTPKELYERCQIIKVSCPAPWTLIKFHLVIPAVVELTCPLGIYDSSRRACMLRIHVPQPQRNYSSTSARPSSSSGPAPDHDEHVLKMHFLMKLHFVSRSASWRTLA